ncbi:MAG: sulfatase [Verrucomicrobiales bacterium]|nr:sulfatase [Verrucomicrobiales bacterium]
MSPALVDSPFDSAPSRRALLKSAACGFGGLALSSFANQSPVIVPRAKRIIFLFMQGGPSQVDTYDYKPELTRGHQKKANFWVPRTRQNEERELMKSFWEFKQYGECGRWSSSLFPEVAKHVDDLCFIHSMHTEGVAHGPATLFLHTGATNLVRPSVGAWISYGLGSGNSNLPAFVTVNPPANKGGPRNWGNAFLPASTQGTVLGQAGNPNAKPEIRNLVSPVSPAESKREYEFLKRLNQVQRGNSEQGLVDGMIASHELAWRMQTHAADLINIDKESRQTQELYGIGDDDTDGFGRQCLAARQLAESGVRFIQVSHCDNKSTPVWDQHNNMPKHEPLAGQVDRPIAGLLTDLKQRGLLEDTLVWWGSEFGRTPFTQNKLGRDHNPRGFTTWLAGGGVKPGFAHGSTDEFGFQAMENKVHMHDLHATLLHLLGLDHKQLTYRYAGRDFRLTDVHGHVVEDILA